METYHLISVQTENFDGYSEMAQLMETLVKQQQKA